MSFPKLHDLRRKTANAKYYQKRKANDAGKATEKKVFFPMRVPENVLARIHRIAAEGYYTGKYPWRTAQEVMRAMLVRGLRAMADEGDEIAAEGIDAIEMMSTLEAMQRTQRQAQSMYAKAREVIGALLDVGAENEALQQYTSTMQLARKLPDTIWASWLQQEMERTFPQLKAEEHRTPGVSL